MKTLAAAVRRVGRTKSTIASAIGTGRLKLVEKTDRGYRIDVAELDRVYPPKTAAEPVQPRHATVHSEDSAGELMLLRHEVQLLRARTDEVRAERDAWRDYARRLVG